MSLVVIVLRSWHRSVRSVRAGAVAHPSGDRVHRSPLNGSRSTKIAVLGFLAAAVSISVVWPQVWLSCRHGRTLGLSPTSSWLNVALNLCWLTFGLLTGDPAQILTHVVVGAGNTAVLAALLLSQPHLRSPRMLIRNAVGGAGLAALAAGSLGAVALLGAAPAVVAATLGTVIGLVGAAGALVQPLGLLMDRDQDLSGLSPARWRLGAGSCALWTSYGLLIAQPMVWLSAGFGLCCAVVMCVLLRPRRSAQTVSVLAELRPAVAAATGRVRPGALRPVLAAA
jgi:uncharacterized protein with PQ loop repeat